MRVASGQPAAVALQSLLAADTLAKERALALPGLLTGRPSAAADGKRPITRILLRFISAVEGVCVSYCGTITRYPERGPLWMPSVASPGYPQLRGLSFGSEARPTGVLAQLRSGRRRRFLCCGGDHSSLPFSESFVAGERRTHPANFSLFRMDLRGG